MPGRQKPVQQKPVEQQAQHQQGRGQEEGQDRQQQPRRVHHQPAGAEQEVHGGYVYKPLADCPTQGTVRDLLEWAIPVEQEHGQEKQAHEDSQQADPKGQGDVSTGQRQHSPEPRRSTRAGRGETSKYEDFVREIGASATNDQMESGLGRRGTSLVAQSRLTKSWLDRRHF